MQKDSRLVYRVKLVYHFIVYSGESLYVGTGRYDRISAYIYTRATPFGCVKMGSVHVNLFQESPNLSDFSLVRFFCEDYQSRNAMKHIV